MSKFKSPTGGYYTLQLFWEQWIELTEDQRSIQPIFTLSKDKPGLINFGKKYVESRDPTGYKVTKEILEGDFKLYERLLRWKWFQAAKIEWDRELEAALTSEALEKIRRISQDDDSKQQLAAAKYLANKEYKHKKNSRGRPSKEDIEAELQRQVADHRTLEDDYKRIKTVNL